MRTRPMTTPPEEARYLTCDDCALLLGVTVDTIRAWIGSRQLIAADVSRGRGERPRWRIDRTDLDRFLAARRTAELPPVAERRRTVTTGKVYV